MLLSYFKAPPQPSDVICDCEAEANFDYYLASTANRENKLQELDGPTLEDFSRKGYLQPIYMAVASYARIRALIDMKNALTK